MGSITQIAEKYSRTSPTTKGLSYYQKYDAAFARFAKLPQSILEIGVFEGESTKIFSETFPAAKIVALDIEQRNISFQGFQNIKFIIANQADPAALKRIIESEFPDGLDLVIEDASHIGALSRITFNTIFPYVKSNGLYAIEDWGTGYWDDWPDGSRFQEFQTPNFDGMLPKRIPSHDAGMVGFVKSLVDLTHEEAIKRLHRDVGRFKSRISSLEFTEGIVFATKA